MSVIPFLTVDERAQYLIDKGYTRETEVSESVRDHLAHNNFHHFLGYARNYGSLISQGRIDEEFSLEQLVDIISADKEVSVILFRALQTLEHQLRAQLVEAHCAILAPTDCFLESSHYIKLSLSRDTPEAALISQILRMKEPYVYDRLKSYMKENKLSGEASDLGPPHRRNAVSRFPIWSFVDGLSFGLLADIILTTKPQEVAGKRRTIRDAIALGCSVNRTMFDTQLRAMIVLRNQVAHHARLWMRPTTNSPKIPNSYKKLGRDLDNKGMYVAWLVLASLFSDPAVGRALILSLDAILESNPVYALGVKNPTQ